MHPLQTEAQAAGDDLGEPVVTLVLLWPHRACQARDPDVRLDRGDWHRQGIHRGAVVAKAAGAVLWPGEPRIASRELSR